MMLDTAILIFTTHVYKVVGFFHLGHLMNEFYFLSDTPTTVTKRKGFGFDSIESIDQLKIQS